MKQIVLDGGWPSPAKPNTSTNLYLYEKINKMQNIFNLSISHGYHTDPNDWKLVYLTKFTQTNES